MEPVYGRFCEQAHIPPDAYRAGKADTAPRLNLSTLEPAIKRQVWLAIQKDAPALMQLLGIMREAVEVFGGDVTVALADLPQSVLDITGRKV